MHEKDVWCPQLSGWSCSMNYVKGEGVMRKSNSCFLLPRAQFKVVRSKIRQWAYSALSAPAVHTMHY